MKISVILSTHNRADSLERTIQAILGLDSKEHEMELIVVDNNSSGRTPELLKSLTGTPNLTLLHESKPGKNCALNKAIETVDLGDVTVFTDDDVTPTPDWLDQIARSVEQNEAFSIFGGAVEPVFQSPPPDWARNGFISIIMFARHNEGPTPKEYGPKDCPVGPNFWIRSEILREGFRYNEFFGPRPKNRLMGSETTFINSLRDAGYRALWVPTAKLSHHIEPEATSEAAIINRSKRYGRSRAYRSKATTGPKNPPLSQIFRGVWNLLAGTKNYLIYYLKAPFKRDFIKKVWATKELSQGRAEIALAFRSYQSFSEEVGL